MAEAQQVTPVSISFCCNNPDNGMPTGRFSNVEIGDNLLSLDNQFYPAKEPRLSYLFRTVGNNGFVADQATGSIKVSRRRFPVIGYKYGWGNWCWDLVLVTPKAAIELANYLQHLGLWSAEGDAEWCDQWDTSKPFDPQDAKWIQSLEEYGYQRP